MKKTEKKKSEKKSTVDMKLVAKLASTIKVDNDAVLKLAKLEKRLLALKAERKASEQKSVRASMRNLTFYRHEHTAETIASLQKIASQIQ